MSTAYRLPDWLGGHDVEVYAISENGLAATIGIVGHESPDFPTARVPREWLVEVRPPSIDDPVELPAICDALTLDAWEPTSKIVARISIVGVSTTVWQGLEVSDLRRLARAAWQRANAVEAGA